MKETVKARDIRVIWHFTRLSNLDSILRYGLISKSGLEVLGIPTEINDPYRLDYQENAICCSISHPNYKMFYALRQNSPDVEWLVLGLKRSILWKKECAFCVANAASSEVTCIPIESRKGLLAFNKLFEEIDGKPTREALGISDRFPTNPQAELLVLQSIEPNYILGVVAENKSIADELVRKYQNLDVRHDRGPFSARIDYEHW